jgi:hypothetical protein
MRIMASRTGTKRRLKRLLSTNRLIQRVDITKAEAKPIPPSRGIFPVWIFRSFTGSYQDFLWETRRTRVTAAQESIKEAKNVIIAIIIVPGTPKENMESGKR